MLYGSLFVRLVPKADTSTRCVGGEDVTVRFSILSNSRCKSLRSEIHDENIIASLQLSPPPVGTRKGVTVCKYVLGISWKALESNSASLKSSLL